MNKERLTAKKDHLNDATVILQRSIAGAQKGLDEATVETLLMACERWLGLAAEVNMVEAMVRKNERSKA